MVVLAHAEGGLVAAEFLERLNGWEDTRLFVPIGTPFGGSVHALDRLVNGARLSIAGTLNFDLTTPYRSMTSLYQILPAYACIDEGENQQLRKVDEVILPGIDPRRVLDGARFLNEFNTYSDATVAETPMLVRPVVGIGQRTAQGVRLHSGNLERLYQLDGSDHGGDGVVSRFAAVSPRMDPYTDRPYYVNTSHGDLPRDGRVLEYTQALLESDDLRTLGRYRRAVEPTVHIEVRDVYTTSETIHANVEVEARGRYVLKLLSERRVVHKLAVDLAAHGSTQVALPLLAEGIYRLNVEPNEAASTVFAVVDHGHLVNEY
ncbi:lipase/acyltransferase domain-containing protein [Geodermatophilus sp. URMC 62]|uniref:lipase/acyltransferase domain-containing protein n=1 Tax=Geodermatophilus sp. URMC 62 TaxID=3423414 RepID=UPI00406C150F